MVSFIKNCVIFLPQGKFIRIHFGPSGKLAGADIETCEYFLIYFILITQ